MDLEPSPSVPEKPSPDSFLRSLLALVGSSAVSTNVSGHVLSQEPSGAGIDPPALHCHGRGGAPCQDCSRRLQQWGRGLFHRMGGPFDAADPQTRIKEGITWHLGDAGDPQMVDALGPQDIVVANRFLCHMAPPDAERCLRNIARLVVPGGYLFVSGIDLDVRTKVANDLGWKPLRELMEDIHDGDPSLTVVWPCKYWGLEPLNRRKRDWEVRYASVFQLGEGT